MSVDKYIKENLFEISEKVFISPNIPEKKLNGAIRGMAPKINPEVVIAIIDTTIFGGAKEGALITGESIFLHALGTEVVEIKLVDVESAEYICTNNLKDNGKLEKKESVLIYYKDKTSIHLSDELYGINHKQFSDLINGIVKLAQTEELKLTSQICPLSMLDAEVKKAYIKLVCNYAFSNQNEINAELYSEIISLIVRTELSVKDRLEIRTYMTAPNEIDDDDILIDRLKQSLISTNEEIIMQSLIKDILYLSRKKEKNNSWKEDSYIINLISKVNVSFEQVDYLLSTIINDEEILNQRKNDSEITKAMKDIIAKAGAVGVPLAAVYFSGSVIGIGATGITSGLAALGMGGVLGFSSMFTGIGVAVLLGVGAYKGVKKVTGLNDLENNKQREKMLQEIIKNSQRSLSYLIEDVNEITKELKIEIEKGLESQVKIEKISKILGMLTKGAQVTSDKIQYAEREKIMTKLPRKLDVICLHELTNTPTKEKYRQYILDCYLEQVVQTENGECETIYCLDDKLPYYELNNLYDTFEVIGYFKMKDLALGWIKGNAKNLAKDILN